MAQLRDISWSKFGPVGKRWKLLSFNTYAAKQSFEQYWSEQAEYWGANNPLDPYFLNHFGGRPNPPMQEFEDYVKQGFKEYTERTKKWHGLCEAGNSMAVIQNKKNTIILSPNWIGRITVETDLEVFLKQEVKFGLIPIRFWCEIIGFGRLEDGTIVSHQKRENGKRIFPVSWRLEANQAEHVIQVGGAYFQVEVQ